MTEYDIRNVIPDIIDEIIIIGNLSYIIKDEQSFNKLRDKGYINEYGYDGQIQHIKLSGLFNLDDVKNKINELVGDTNVKD